MKGFKNLLLLLFIGLSQWVNAQEFIYLDSATDKNYIIKGALSPKIDIFYHFEEDYLQKVEYIDAKSQKMLVMIDFIDSKYEDITVLGKYGYKFVPSERNKKYLNAFVYDKETNELFDPSKKQFHDEFYFADTNNLDIVLNDYDFGFSFYYKYSSRSFFTNFTFWAYSRNYYYFKKIYLQENKTIKYGWHTETQKHLFPGSTTETIFDSSGFHLNFNKKGKLTSVYGVDGFETNFWFSLEELKNREFAGIRKLKDTKFDFTTPNLSYDTIKNHTKDGYTINHIFHKNDIKAIQLINKLGQKEIEIQLDKKNLLKRVLFIQDSIILPCSNGYLDRFLISKEKKNTSAIDLVKLLGPHEIQLNNVVLKTIDNSNTLIFEKDSITFVVDYTNYGQGNTHFLQFNIQGYQETIYFHEGKIIETQIEGFKTKGFSREFYHPRKRTKPVTRVRTKLENIHWSDHTIKNYIKGNWHMPSGI